MKKKGNSFNYKAIVILVAICEDPLQMLYENLLFCRKVFIEAKERYESIQFDHSFLFGSCKKVKECSVNSQDKKEETKVMTNPCSENEGFECVPSDVCDNVHLFYDGSGSFHPRLTDAILRSGMPKDFIRSKDWYCDFEHCKRLTKQVA